MKIVETVVLLSRGDFAQSKEWVEIRDTIHAAIAQAEWPVGAGSFIIHPESGKKSVEGNGVVPIKAKPMAVLKDDGWALEYPWEVATKAGVAGRGRAKGTRPGSMLPSNSIRGWLSSSGRPATSVRRTDRIGNIEEIRPYIPLWENLSVAEGVLELVIIEQDGESTNSPRIPKGKDGRAAEGMLAALIAKS